MNAPLEDQHTALHTDAAGLPADTNAEGEALRRSLATMWLAEASPLVAAPADSLARVHRALGMAPGAPAAVRPIAWPLAALAGWAAAACLTVLLWRGRAGHTTAPSPATRPPLAHSSAPLTPRTPATPPAVASPAGPAVIQPLHDPGLLRSGIASLRARAREARSSTPGVHRPVIFELRPPGTPSSAGSQDHVLDIIATALERDLQRQTASASSEVVIERGWATWSADALPGGTTFRHRAFPVNEAATLGLMPGPGGEFLDPTGGWLWSPDPATGDYTGRAAPPQFDRTAFTRTTLDQAPLPNANVLPVQAPGSSIASAIPVGKETPTPLVASNSYSSASTRTANTSTALGYAVGTDDGQTIVALSNLPTGDSLTLAVTDNAGQLTNYTLPGDYRSFSAIIPSSQIASFAVVASSPGRPDALILQTP